MVCIDVPKIRGKMAEKGYNLTSLSEKLHINRNTLSGYLESPDKIPYGVISELAEILFDSMQEAASVFFAVSLR